MYSATVKIVASKFNNKILLCLTENIYIFIIVFQFYNITEFPLQKKILKKVPMH